MMEFTPAARAELQLMNANAASDLSKRAELVAAALGKRIIGKAVLEIAALATDEAIDAMHLTDGMA